MGQRGFRESLAVGKIGESAIAEWLRSRGNYVLPVYEIEMSANKGPRLFTPKSDLIAPDLLVFKVSGEIVWIEAKHKSAFSPHRLSNNRLVTGIDLRHYLHYCELASQSPWPVWLLFLQRGSSAANCPSGTPTGLFGNNLAILQKCENHRHGNWGTSGMVYWAIDKLKKLATIEELEALQTKAA